MEVYERKGGEELAAVTCLDEARRVGSYMRDQGSRDKYSTCKSSREGEEKENECKCCPAGDRPAQR